MNISIVGKLQRFCQSKVRIGYAQSDSNFSRISLMSNASFGIGRLVTVPEVPALLCTLPMDMITTTIRVALGY